MNMLQIDRKAGLTFYNAWSTTTNVSFPPQDNETINEVDYWGNDTKESKTHSVLYISKCMNTLIKKAPELENMDEKPNYFVPRNATKPYNPRNGLIVETSTETFTITDDVVKQAMLLFPKAYQEACEQMATKADMEASATR